ncbi:unnamed protein product [Protopolystoma xenopodis]|uniref:Uncharacterized protein n=1 Tax=Protopolystoma xenopodis TaxID=117903 RepID=A0A3S4ZN21_9PLAT|nr:unnamed protein product [Protopolystoma xenopodis]
MVVSSAKAWIEQKSHIIGSSRLLCPSIQTAVCTTERRRDEQRETAYRRAQVCQWVCRDVIVYSLSGACSTTFKEVMLPRLPVADVENAAQPSNTCSLAHLPNFISVLPPSPLSSRTPPLSLLYPPSGNSPTAPLSSPTATV